jgi:predicted secreted Zn-dependent protease
MIMLRLNSYCVAADPQCIITVHAIKKTMTYKVSTKSGTGLGKSMGFGPEIS